jgi:hypothetical protein
MDPVAFILADQGSRRHVHSAQPNAPVIPDEPLPRRRRDEIRTTAAQWLHLVAERVEPSRRQECAPGA